jgi:hypothetical protein
MSQAKGAASQVLLDFETTYGADPASVNGIAVPFNYPFDLGGEEPLKASETHQSRRDAAEPTYDNHDVKGSITIPVDQLYFGYWLRALMGAPTTTRPAQKAINNGAPAVDVGGGVVGIPCTSHGFAAGTPIQISATVAYNGHFTVLSSSTTHQINITASYAAETFGSDDKVQSDIYTHVFKPADTIESLVVEKGFTDIDAYFKYNGVKVNKMSLEFTGKGGELSAKLELMGAKETLSGISYDSTPITLTMTKFQNRQASVKEAGSTVADIKSLSLDISNELDGDTFVIAGGGIRGGLNEGDCLASGKMSAMFENLTLYNKAVNGTESSIEVILTSGLYSLTLKVPELFFSRKSPSIVKGGVWVEPEFQGFYANSTEAAIIQATLINTQTTYG